MREWIIAIQQTFPARFHGAGATDIGKLSALGEFVSVFSMAV